MAFTLNSDSNCIESESESDMYINDFNTRRSLTKSKKSIFNRTFEEKKEYLSQMYRMDDGQINRQKTKRADKNEIDAYDKYNEMKAKKGH